ncbi:MAG: adenylosuccinate synthase [Anaerolineae bacterium]
MFLSKPNWHGLYQQIYERGELFGVDRALANNPLIMTAEGVRPNTIAVGGGAFGDEGKGRIVDALCARFSESGLSPLIYRWNGGANAGHTVIVNGQRMALHQLPSGVAAQGSVAVLGKGMVIHPGDLLSEFAAAADLIAHNGCRVYVQTSAVLALDTHRAFEAALRNWEKGGSGATGRGISPAYADVLLRHPVRVRDFYAQNWREIFSRHYELYASLIRGLGAEMASIEVPRLDGEPFSVGDLEAFINRLGEQRQTLAQVIGLSDNPFPEATPNMPIIFEGAQAIGLDARYGVYPDITASDPTFAGIAHSTEGAILPHEIAVRAGAIKATYTSSVGARRLPTAMPEAEAHRIREDAHEYGATTLRPRDIAYIDLPCLSFFARVSAMTHVILTHLDIAYADMPIKVCVGYADDKRYRPDQAYLDTVKPEYIELPSWNGRAIQGVRKLNELPREALQYIAFITQALGVLPLMATTGPDREALISWV